jgi:predicted phage terminase large subunit-like protein
MAMRKRPKLTELKFDRKVEELQAFAREAVSPFGDRSPEAKKERLARAEWDYDFFCQTYLPHYFDTPSAEFHYDLILMAQQRPDPSRGEAVIPSVAAAPRGFGKSTPIAFAYPLWEALYHRRFNIVIGSETKDLAESHVASIAAECMDNQRILYDFSPGVDSLKKGHLVLKGGPSIYARGAGQQFRGIKHGPHRPDLVILDDLENDKLAVNPERVKFLLRWIVGTVYPSIGKTGTLIIIGTIIDRRSALATMLHSPEEPWCLWHRRVYRAITEEGKSLWPEMYSLELLKGRRAAMGPALFNQEYMNDPRNDNGLFQEEWIQTFDPEAPEFLAKMKDWQLIHAGFCDPSARTGESNDFKAVITVGLDVRDMTYYVLDAFIRRCSTKTVARAIAEREQRFNYWRFGIEDNGFQMLFLEEVDRVTTEAGVSVTLTGVTHTGLSKEMRLAGLSPLVERGKVLFLAPQHRNPDYHRLMEQLLFFPSATVHDDGPDALEGAVSLLKRHQCAPIEYESISRRRTASLGRGTW